MTPNHARACVKTHRTTESSKNRRSHLAQDAFLFSVRVFRTTFSLFKFVFPEFSHSLALEPTPVGAFSSAFAVDLIAPAWLSSLGH